MEPIRENLWNIPHWAQVAMYVSQGMAFAVLLGRLWMRSQVWAQGQGSLSFDHLWQRLVRVFKYAIAQLKIARQQYAGIMHAAIFWAMILLLIGTSLALLDYDVFETLLHSKILYGNFYLVYEGVLDFASLVGILGISMAIARRAFQRPVKLTYSVGFTAMLWIILLDMSSGLLVEALRLAVVQPDWQMWSFAGYALSRVILLFHPTEEFLRSAHLMVWLGHLAFTPVIYVIFLDMPLKHIVYSPLNIFFSPIRQPGALTPLNLEDESIERFGVAMMNDYSSFQLLNGDACTECGRCMAVCPAVMAGTPLNPKQIILDIQRGMDQYGVEMVSHRPGDMPALTSEAAMWACTTCRACVYECPVNIEHVDAIVDLRRSKVLNEGNAPVLLQNAMTNAERAGDPWGNQKGSRMAWAQGLSVPLMADKKKADVLYWLGCAGSYDPNSQRTSRAMVKIFEAAGIDYAVLGEEERCNCEWARRAGNEYLFQEASHSNIAVFDKYEFKTIVTHCPHCFNTFKNEYPQFGGEYDVVHHSTYITSLIEKGFLKVGKSKATQITYHDSCYLGRYNEVYDDPREALRAVQGIQVIEMARSRQQGLCCGGGGAQVWFETHHEVPVNQIRLEEAIATGADTISTACPFCTIMLTSAAQSKGIGETTDVRDLAVIVAESLA
jgi:Fe-S oxidoreductase